MTIEESWKIVNKEMYLRDNSLGKIIHDNTWRVASENQQKIEEMFEGFLAGLHCANIWEGTEWKYQRLWREVKQMMEE